MVHEPEVSASPGSLREMQVIGPCSRSSNQDTRGGAQQSVLTSPPVDSSVHSALTTIVVTSFQIMNS